jgi:predicted RNA-binding Zn-ribbon protein involved in translation (DUF1610 family)
METISLERVMEAIRADDDVGFCIACGAKVYGIEPDARKYSCEECGKPQVYGAQELLFRLAA